MSFIADKQTITDLNLLGKYKQTSIYSLFNHVRTNGGERLLGEMFQHPFTQPEPINERSAMFQYFHKKEPTFSFDSETFMQMEGYLGIGSSNNYLTAVATSLYHKFTASFLRDEQYDNLHTGLLATVDILNSFRDFLQSMKEDLNSPYASESQMLNEIFEDKYLGWLIKERNTKTFSLLKFAKYDHLLKHKLQDKIELLVESMYRIDVYIAVSNVARSNNFHYACAQPAGDHLLSTSALRHPALVKGIANPIYFQKDQNLMFLTGANMAGKSTFMKAFGIAVYLAHMGFPVAAENMRFSVLDGIYSSINVADDLNLGYSHFYAEVLRVKHVAEEVASGKNLVVLFDELFKGTNVKDAFDGTLAVTAAFSKYRNCFYIVSTHIIEVSEELKKQGNHISFAYLPTVMDGTVPHYTYLVTEGVTSDRQGMIIIENEGILEIIRSQSA